MMMGVACYKKSELMIRFYYHTIHKLPSTANHSECLPRRGSINMVHYQTNPSTHPQDICTADFYNPPRPRNAKENTNIAPKDIHSNFCSPFPLYHSKVYLYTANAVHIQVAPPPNHSSSPKKRQTVPAHIFTIHLSIQLSRFTSFT